MKRIQSSARPTVRARPFLLPQLCKACGRCIDACPKGCIALGDTIDPRSGFAPVTIDLETCSECGLCLEACPEPHGLMADPGWPAREPEELFEPPPALPERPRLEIPGEIVELPASRPLALKGTHAAAVGALLAGCRHVYGYPITPSTEGAEMMADLLPKLDGVFVQAVSEVATVNHMYGCSGAGLPCMTFTSSPGLSLMLEGISYMIGAELPGVFLHVMRGGPGLGNIAPEQADLKLLSRGLGHGNTHAPVFLPASPQEMLELTVEAFEISFAYRSPVFVVGDGHLGQMTSRVRLPREMRVPHVPSWAVWGDRDHRRNVIHSIRLAADDLENHNHRLNAKYDSFRRWEQKAETVATDDADWLIVAAGTPARMAKGALRILRERGLRVGLFRPITLWPFPIAKLRHALRGVRGIIVVEAGPGQLEDEVRLALSHAELAPPPLWPVRRLGGMLPSVDEIVAGCERFVEGVHDA